MDSWVIVQTFINPQEALKVLEEGFSLIPAGLEVP